MTKRTTYLPGVPCWVDIVQPDVDATKAFYGELLGWTFEPRTPPGAPQSYAYARLDGLTVGGVGGPPASETGGRAWTSYVCVESADDTVAKALAAGGRVLEEPVDVGPPWQPTGRPAVVADPAGAAIGIWQPAELHGAELVNGAGSWNFSHLRVDDPGRVEAFYADVFGWELDVLDLGTGEKSGMWRLPGYGDFLALDDPDIRERQSSAPPGFADAVALLGFAGAPVDTAGSDASWGIVFSVADGDEAVARAEALGATVVAGLSDTDYTRMATVRDPQGAVLTLSQYRPPA